MWSPPEDRFSRAHLFAKNKVDKESDLVVPLKRKSLVIEEHNDQPEEITHLKKTIDTLQDEVKRLNVELSRYQTKYPPVTIEESKLLRTGNDIGLEEDDPLPPWLANAQYLSPLF